MPFQCVSDRAELVAETFLQAWLQLAHECIAYLRGAERLSDNGPDLALFRRQIADVFWEEVHLHAGGGAVFFQVGATTARQGAVIAGTGHGLQHLLIDVRWEDSLKGQMHEGRFGARGGVDGFRYMVDDALNSLLVHAITSSSFEPGIPVSADEYKKLPVLGKCRPGPHCVSAIYG
jgi:hypothetical protein